MPAPFPARPSLWLQAGLVVLLTGLAVSLIFQRLAPAAWAQPHWLEGDPLEVYARVKIAGEQPGATLTHLATVAALGAPVSAAWTGYPAPDRIVFTVTGWLGREIGLIAAIQLVSAGLLCLNALSFFLCARWLRWPGAWAVGLAIAFALCTYNLRWGITLSFSQTFTLPPLILLCARAARRGPAPGRGWFALAGALGLWLAQGNPYLAYFAGVVAGGAGLLGLLRRVPVRRLAPLGLFLAVLTVGFLAVNAAHLRHLRADAADNPLVRSLDDVRTYSLRPAEWLVPPADHRLAWLGAIGRHYHASRLGQGEFFYNYLGLLGAAGLAGLLLAQAAALRRRHRRLLEPTLGLAWITAFGVVGGLNYWLGAAGLDVFRASTRIGIFAEVWLLLFVGGWLARRTHAWPWSLTGMLALVLAAAAVWDQTPPLGDPTVRQQNHRRWQQYASLTGQLERELPAGAMVFQLPVVPFPEAGRTGAMPDYEHLLPYLTSSTLRYSYGQLRTSPVLRWARYTTQLPAAEMLAALERAGFAALWLDQRAYADGGFALLAALKASGRTELTPPGEELPVRIFRLNPAPRPERPDFADPRLLDAWDDAAGQPGVLALRGWYGLEREAGNRWRWAGREAAIGLWADQAGGPVTLRFRLGGPSQSGVTVLVAGRPVWRGSPGPQIHHLTLPLATGLNTLVWQLEGNTFRPGGADPRELGFMVENLSMSVP